MTPSPASASAGPGNTSSLGSESSAARSAHSTSWSGNHPGRGAVVGGRPGGGGGVRSEASKL